MSRQQRGPQRWQPLSLSFLLRPAPCLEWQKELLSQAENALDPDGSGHTSTASLPVEGWKALKVLEHLGNFRKTSERQLTSRGVCADALGSPMVGELLTPDPGPAAAHH